MERDYLLKYKEKLSKLSEEEKLKRDLYIKDLASGKLQGPPTYYPSIDQPWLEHFNVERMHSLKNDKTIYQDIYELNKDHLKEVCIEFFGAKITYKKLFENIDNAAKSFKKMGVKSGDFVTICCAGTPELIYSVYALAKIGAVANLMAPYFEQDQMIERIKDCESNLVLVMDKFYNRIKDAISQTDIKNIVIMPTLNSSVLRFIPQKNDIKYEDNMMQWNKFIDISKNEPNTEVFPYIKDYPLCLVYSSGTTGSSKAILLTHDSFQNSVLSYQSNKFDINRGQKMYQIIPPWYSTGLNTSIHLALHGGVIVFQDPRFERDVFVKNIIKHKINYAVAPTSMFEGFLDEKNVKGKKIPNLENPFEGGEPLPAEVKYEIEDVWEKMGCKSKLTAGYGQCECGATVTSPSQYIYHHVGSVALPIPGVTIAIFDDNNNELPFNIRGNIYIDTPCGMKEYYKNPQATQEYFFEDGYGHKWSKTGDIGFISPNGDLFISGRKSDFTMIGSKKVFNFDVEAPVMMLKDIKNCDCLPFNKDGEIKLALHIIFDDKYKDIYSDKDKLQQRLGEIQRLVFNECEDIDMVPELFKIRESFPYKPSGKRDIEKLKSETDSFIYMNRNESISKGISRKRK